MMKKFWLVLTSFAVVPWASASVTLHFQGGTFQRDDLTLAPAGSLVLVIADTAGDGFGTPAIGDFLGGSSDDILLDELAITVEGFLSSATQPLSFSGDPGYVAQSPSYTGTWGPGDPLGILFVPSLNHDENIDPANPPADSSDDARATDGLKYGFYSDPAWTTPVDGTTQSGGAGSNTALTIENGGALPNDTLVADMVIPEPSATMLAGLGFLAFFMRRRRTSGITC